MSDDKRDRADGRRAVSRLVPVATVNGCRLYDDRLGGLTAYRGDTLIGVAYPEIANQVGGRWNAGTSHHAARLFDNRAEALRWLTREDNR
jgi:hypothetical protein